MMPVFKAVRAVAIILLASVQGAAFAQRSGDAGYPERPVRFIVPQAAGGTNDVMARFVGGHLAERLGKPVVVENRTGADGIIGTEIAARATPDGHTLFMASAAYTMNPAVRKLPYDPSTAFSWIALLGSGNNMLVTHPSFPARTVKEVVALGKAKPKYLNLASAGGYQHFISEMFRQMAGIDVVVVLYKGGFPAMVDVIGGQAHMALSSLSSAQPHVRAGKLRALATTGLKRSALFPELPTVSEAGVPGYEAANYWVVAAPAGAPPAIVRRLNGEINAVLALAETQKRFAAEGAETDAKTPAEIDAFIKADLAKWLKVARDAGLKRE